MFPCLQHGEKSWYRKKKRIFKKSFHEIILNNFMTSLVIGNSFPPLIENFKKYGKIKKNMDKQGEKKAKNVKGVFFTDKTGLNLILSRKEFFFVKQTFVKNTP